MKCPNDDTVLQMTDRQGVEIDYCPTCRGVWLDRGELDKILERSRADSGREDDDDDDRPYAAPTEQPRRDDGWQDDRARNPRGYEDQRPQPGQPASGQYPPKKKRGGFLEDLLDFG